MCERCQIENLAGALEYRCCREVLHVSGKMAFDGSIEHIKCITEHQDYQTVSNKAVLFTSRTTAEDHKRKDLSPCRAGVSENE